MLSALYLLYSAFRIPFGRLSRRFCASLSLYKVLPSSLEPGFLLNFPTQRWLDSFAFREARFLPVAMDACDPSRSAAKQTSESSPKTTSRSRKRPELGLRSEQERAALRQCQTMAIIPCHPELATGRRISFSQSSNKPVSGRLLYSALGSWRTVAGGRARPKSQQASRCHGFRSQTASPPRRRKAAHYRHDHTESSTLINERSSSKK